ncbi:MAG: Transcriptional regulator of heat shock protein [Candidatus Giovannonibacteria bacterium GW2011_GWA2_53_7]|uniref:Transcriptional regulator of heat shock protein n=1 Tax=Candidatus Giovannonibacteria bacterium GW2011_GWA2_53_7 TaxID=1618650 RepID=A0A0G2AR34_9BACT|nr:MAG: Transcriptional regulator of heat shock protein [Candidatus Giovannonibacteria bacterium GW2011_GWA2_53_7]
MDSRKKALLSQIIRQYVKSALPVGSKLLEASSRLGVSSATIRNEMADLEKDGYIIQPHTSAGRIPTEKGYRFFLENYVQAGRITDREKKAIQNVLKKGSVESSVKEVAKKLAEFSQNAVIAVFSDSNIYYTGLANLFSQPEFKQAEMVYNISLVIDHLEQVVERIFGEVDQTLVKIGSDNPFGQDCSSVLGRWQINSQSGIMAILGPMRMDYEKNLGLINYLNREI